MQPIYDKFSTFESVLKSHEDFTYREAGQPSLGEKSLASIKAIQKAIEDGWTAQLNWSGGKDSSVTLHLFLMALVNCVRQGKNVSQHHFVLHANTGVENPEVQHLADKSIRDLNAFIARHNLPLKVIVATPSFTQSWVGRILTGRGLPTFPGSEYRQCSQDLKVSSANRARAKHMKGLSKAERQKVCLILGSRDEEGAQRAASIARFNGQAHEVTVTDKGGELYPVKDWSTENVWEFLLSVGENKPLPSYTDSMTPTAELYKDSTGECIWSSAGQKQSAACGARHGCFVCQAGGDDKSMVNMLKSSERYDYMKPLYRIQQLISKTRYDWSKRSPVGRTIYDGGFIRWQPDVYSVDFTEKLLRACVSADYLEAKRAQDTLEAIEAGRIEDNAHNRRMALPQFRIVSDEQIIMVDFVWSLHNYHDTPFKALEIYKSVWEHGEVDELLEVDAMEAVPRTPMPAAKWIHVGSDWVPHQDQGGLVDNFAALTQFDTDIGSWTKPVKTQHGVRELIAAEEEAEFTVDMESAYFVLNYEYDRLIEKARSGAMTPSAAAHYYLRVGTIAIAKGKIAMYDTMAARGQRYRALGLSGQHTYDALPANRKVLSNSQYKRYLERVKTAGIKRLKWWAFMGWFTQAHLASGTVLGQALRNQLKREEETETQQQEASRKARYQDATANAINTQAMVALGLIKPSDGFVARQMDRFNLEIESGHKVKRTVRAKLQDMRDALVSGRRIVGLPATADTLYQASPTALIVVLDTLLGAMKVSVTTEHQLELAI